MILESSLVVGNQQPVYGHRIMYVAGPNPSFKPDIPKKEILGRMNQSESCNGHVTLNMDAPH